MLLLYPLILKKKFNITRPLLFKILAVAADATRTSADYAGMVYVLVRGKNGTYEEKFILKKAAAKKFEMFGSFLLLDETNVYVGTARKEVYYYPHGIQGKLGCLAFEPEILAKKISNS